MVARWLGVCGLALLLLACDDDDPVAPQTGTLTVEVTTSGDGTDADGFVVSLDSGAGTEEVEVDGSVTFEELEPGDHTVELTDLATNCSVDGDNPQSLSLSAGGEKTVTFAVTCTA